MTIGSAKVVLTVLCLGLLGLAWGDGSVAGDKNDDPASISARGPATWLLRRQAGASAECISTSRGALTVVGSGVHKDVWYWIGVDYSVSALSLTELLSLYSAQSPRGSSRDILWCVLPRRSGDVC